MSNISLYQAWCENERQIRKDVRHLKKLLNRAMRANQRGELETLTRMYAMLYSVYAETVFQKIIRTPHGLNDEEMRRVQIGANLEEKWRKCLEVCFDRIDSETNRDYVASKREKMNGLLMEYVVEPLRIRNKIAHGQSAVCFNNACTNVNSDTTEKMKRLNYVETTRYFRIYQIFAQCVEDLIESPHRAHFRFFETRMIDLEEYIKGTEAYSIESKRDELLRKPLRPSKTASRTQCDDKE